MRSTNPLRSVRPSHSQPFPYILAAALAVGISLATDSSEAARTGAATTRARVTAPAHGVVREEIIPVRLRPSAPRVRGRHFVPPPLEEVYVFQDSLDGRPLDDEAGWTHYDRSEAPTAWHIDSLYACQGRAWWCGVVDSSWVFDTNRMGYGNSWNHFLMNTVRLDTIPGGTVAKIGWRQRHNIEKDYDYGLIEVLDLEEGWTGIGAYTGKKPQNQSQCDTITVSIPDSVRVQWNDEPGGPYPMPFRFVFQSDVGFSSADGLYDGDGWSIDNITVSAGSQVRFFDNCEGGMGAWDRTVLPAVGDYFSLSSNVSTEDICTENRSSVWTDWDPFTYSVVYRMDNALVTPAVHVQRASVVFLAMDVYRNLPLHACFYYSVNFRTKNVGDPGWSEWVDPTRLLYYGSTKDWVRQRITLTGAGEVDSVQVQVVVKDYSDIYCDGNGNTSSVYPLFDNVAIGIIAVAPPSIVERKVDLFNDTFRTTAFFADDNFNTPLGDSAVVQLNVSGGYLSSFMYYRMNGGSWTSVPLQPSTATIPTIRYADVPPGNYPAGTTLEYYFSVTDSTNATAYLPPDAPNDQIYFSASILPLKYPTNPALGCTDSLATVLFVDNHSGRDPILYYQNTLTALGYKFDIWDVNAPSSGLGNTPGGTMGGGPYDWPPTDVNSLLQYSAIIWHAGSLNNYTVRQADQALLQSWIQQPGLNRNVWVAGDNVAYELGFQGENYNSFLQFTLGASYLRNIWEDSPQDSLHPVISGVAGSPSAGRTVTASSDCPVIEDFDAITTSPQAVAGGKAGAFLRYPNTLTAATRYATKYVPFGTDSARAILQAFSFSNIEAGGDRLQLMTVVMQGYFGEPPCYYPSAVEEERIVEAPVFRNALHQNAPNPFNPRTVIRYAVAKDGRATLRIFNAAGVLVRTLVDGPHPAGEYTARWDGTDDAGRRLGSGVYFYRLESESGFRDAKKLILVK